MSKTCGEINHEFIECPEFLENKDGVNVRIPKLNVLAKKVI